MASYLKRLVPPNQKHNFRVLQTSPISELSGAMGDLGTLLPLLIGLTLTQSINLPTTLFFTGLSNILTGVFFEIPLPVQPMKAIAAIAISNKFTITETTSAGLFVSAVVLAASITGLLGWIGRVVPIPVIKGIQVGAGLNLAMSGGNMIKGTHSWFHGDSYIVAFVTFLALLLSTRPRSYGVGGAQQAGDLRTPKMPYALLITIIGVFTGIILFAQSFEHSGRAPNLFHIWQPKVYIPSPEDFKVGTLTAGLGQLPLTVLNSIIAATHLSAEILPPPAYPDPPSFSALGFSVGVMNMVGCWFGAMPTCHGSGGLAGQVKFGARSGSSIIALGLIKLILGLVVSEKWLVGILDRFPRSLLGVMIIAAGLELARVGESVNLTARDLRTSVEDDGVQAPTQVANYNGEVQKFRQLNEDERGERYYTMMLTTGFLLAFSNDAIGFIAGMLCHWSIVGHKAFIVWRRNRYGEPDERTSLLGTEQGIRGNEGAARH